MCLNKINFYEKFPWLATQVKADRLQMKVVAKKYICVATVHQ